MAKLGIFCYTGEMPFEQPHQDPNQLKGSAENQEKGPETVDPAAMAKERIDKANQHARKNKNSIQQTNNLYMAVSSRVWTPEERAEKEAADAFITSFTDTKKILDQRIQQYEALLRTDREAWGRGERSNQNTHRNMFAVDRYKEPEQEVRALNQLKNLAHELDGLFMQTHRMNDLKKMRVRLALPELPQSLVSDRKAFDQSALDAAIQKDPTLSVDWEKIRAEFNQVETTLNRTETVLHILDTGAGIASGLVPYGSEVYQLSRSMTHVLQGTMTPEDAARDFIVGVLSSHIGGKVAKKLHVEKFVSTWVKKNAKYFSKKTAEQLARVTSKTLAGATQGGITGAADGTMSGTYNVLRGKQTVEQAVDETANKALIGMLFGGAMGGGMETWKIRGETLNEAHMRQLKQAIMSLPDGDRPKAAESILGRELTRMQKDAVVAAHDIPMKDGQKYSAGELYEKMRILEASGLSRNEADTLLRMGVCGSIPLPPPPGKGPRPTPAPSATPTVKQTLPPPPRKKEPTQSPSELPDATMNPKNSELATNMLKKGTVLDEHWNAILKQSAIRKETSINNGQGILLEDAILFHGSSTSGIVDFRTATDSTVGAGLYLTPQAFAARAYGKSRASVPEFGKEPTVYAFKIENAKILDLRNNDNIQSILRGFKDRLKDPEFLQIQNRNHYQRIAKDIEQLSDNLSTIKNGNLKMAIGNNLQKLFSKYCASLGYDGLRTLEGGENGSGNHYSYVFFAPDRIKPISEFRDPNPLPKNPFAR